MVLGIVVESFHHADKYLLRKMALDQFLMAMLPHGITIHDLAHKVATTVLWWNLGQILCIQWTQVYILLSIEMACTANYGKQKEDVREMFHTMG